jgi:glycosyltransferase involved in cell wall biosynthesis
VARFEAELFPALDGLGLAYEVLAVDDGSTDGTRAALERLAKARPALRVLVHSHNRGLGAALRTAFAEARGEWIACLDADLTFSPGDLRALLEQQKRTDADLVGGSPFLSAEGAAQVPLARRLPSLFLNAFYRGLLTHHFTAYTPMFRLYRASALKELTLRSEGFEISAEIAALFVRRRKKLAEVPTALSTRRAGVSKLNRLRELRRHAALIGRLMTAR